MCVRARARWWVGGYVRARVCVRVCVHVNVHCEWDHACAREISSRIFMCCPSVLPVNVLLKQCFISDNTLPTMSKLRFRGPRHRARALEHSPSSDLADEVAWNNVGRIKFASFQFRELTFQARWACWRFGVFVAPAHRYPLVSTSASKGKADFAVAGI